MNGADLVIDTLLANSIEVCFTNPGTSEIHLIAALDSQTQMRGILTLFEGVATGAADGYGRMADQPAATLLHLGPGLANGLANLHNARRARTPIVNIVGEHASYHKKFDAPLESDIELLAENVSGWWRTSRSAETVTRDVTDAIAAAVTPPGQVATLILPADVSWAEVSGDPTASRSSPADPVTPPEVDTDVTEETEQAERTEQIEAVARAIRSGERTALLLGGFALRRDALEAAGRIEQAAGVKLFAETFPARLERGAGIVQVERLSYLAEFATMQLEGIDNLVLVGASAPVSFFAHPTISSSLVPPDCRIFELASSDQDVRVPLDALVEYLGVSGDQFSAPKSWRPERPTGPLDAQTLGLAIGALLPEGAIVVDESQTSGIFSTGATTGCPPHDWLTLTGGAIGMGLPLATGAAIAVPGSRVLSLQADGSAMYTIQALWTQAREGLDVTTVILNNRSYAILDIELHRFGYNTPGGVAEAMFDLSHPPIDFVELASAMGVHATRASTAEELTEQLARSFSQPGPTLIEAIIPPIG